jgi:Tfp pilus assembly protein PilO
MVVLALLVLFLLVLPKFGELSDVQEQLDRAQGEESALQTQLTQLQEAADRLPRIQRQLARFRREVPPVADLPGLINELQDAADTSGVDFFAISPGEPVAAPAGRVAEIPAQIQVVGGFFPVDQFLFRLETLPRASNVASVQVGEGPDGLPQIDVLLQVTFFTTDLDAGPGAPPPAGAAPQASPSPAASPGASPSPALSPSPAGSPTPGA